MFKEKGYDEFLAKKIQRGIEDSFNGRVVDVEQSRLISQQRLRERMQELERYRLLEQEQVYA